MEVKYNEVHKETASTLQDIKDQVAAIRDSQQKMWRTIDSMGKELQELVRGMLVPMRRILQRKCQRV